MLSHRWVSYSLCKQFINLLVLVSIYYMSEPQNEVFEAETLLLKNLRSPPPQDSKSWKFLVEAHQYTTLSCFTAWFNLLAQFNKLYPWTLKNVTPEEQKERKKMTNPRPQNPLAKKKIYCKNETSIPIKWFWDFEIRPNFSESHIFKVPFYTPISKLH